MEDDFIIEELNNLIIEGKNLIKSDHRLAQKSRYIKRWQGKSQNLIKIRFGLNSDYYQDFLSTTSNNRESVQRGTGVLEYVHYALKNGLTED